MGYNDPGSAGSVQAGDPGSEADAEGLAGAYQQIVGRNKKAQGPNANAYNKQVSDAQGNADAYSDRARNFTQDAPTIANVYQDQSRSDIGGNVGSQRMLAEHLGDIMSGKDVTGAQNEIQQGTDAGIAAQLSMARSAKGGGAAQAGAYRAAQQQSAVQQAGVAAQAGQLQAQLASAAAGQQANVYGNIGSQLGQQYGIEQGSAIHQADLQGQNQGQIDQTRLGYGALGNNAQGGSLNALNGYTQGSLSAQGLQPGIDANNGGGKLIGTGASIAGAMMMSDERVKDGIQTEGDKEADAEEAADARRSKQFGSAISSIGDLFKNDAPASGGTVGGPGYTSDVRTKNVDAGGGSRVDAFLEGIHPLSYHYKAPSNEPRSQPTGGRYLGISAQDLEAVPEVGHQMVSDGPRGKQVEIGPSLSAALAGIARLHERLKAVEGGHVTSDMTAKRDVATESRPLQTTSASRKATPGAIEEGNINHYGRGEVDNGDGTRSTVRSMSFSDGPGREVLIPTAYDGAVHSDDQAIAHYRQTGQHMGIYKTPEAATAQAMKVHEDYENGRYADVGSHVMEQRERHPLITSDMAAKTDVSTEGAAPYVDPRAKAWDEGHNEALNKVQQYRMMTPEQLKELSDRGNRLASAVRGAKADAYDEAHGISQHIMQGGGIPTRNPVEFTRGDDADASRQHPLAVGGRQ